MATVLLMLIVLTTTPNLEEANLLAEKIVAEKFAACVQILPQMTSVYFWEGEIQKEPEHLLLIKTVPEKWNKLCEFIKSNHSYSVPEIAAIDAEKVSAEYRRWLTDYLMDN